MVSLGSMITSQSQSRSNSQKQTQLKSKTSETPERVLKEFISSDPKAEYTFDSERDAPESEICRQQQREGKRYEECINLRMNSKKLFATMQDYGYFCALPSNPEKTHMECKRMP